MATNLNKKRDTNLLLFKKDSHNVSSTHELNKMLLNFNISTCHKNNNSKIGILYNNMNNISKISNYQSKNINLSITNNYFKNSSPATTNFKTSNIDISNSNDITRNIKGKESKENILIKEYKKTFHHKKINSHLLNKNNQILSDLFPCNTTTNANKPKELLLKYKKKSTSKTLRKKHIQIDTNNINNNSNVNVNQYTNVTKKITNSLSNNNNNIINQPKINLKIYLEKHSRVLSTDNNISSINSKNQKIEKKISNNNNINNNINSVIKSNRIITKKYYSKRMINNLNYKASTLSRANSSWIKNEMNIFNTSLEYSFSKNSRKIKKKINDKAKTKINNVIVKNFNNFIKDKKLKINDNIDIKKNDLLNLNKLKEKKTLYYLTNISEELKSKKKNFHNENNIFISINNYTNNHKKRSNKSNVNLTEGKEINIPTSLSKKSTSHKGMSDSRGRNALKKKENKHKRIISSKNHSSETKTDDNFNSNNSDSDKIDGPELTHFYLVSVVQKGLKNTKNYI